MTVMASVTLSAGANVPAFNNFAGNQGLIYYFDETSFLYEIPIPPGNQVQLNGKLTAYNANQAAIDAAFSVDEDNRQDTRLQQKYDNDEVLNAVVEVMRLELNTLRALHALPDITAGAMDGAIKAKIANP